MSVYLSCFCVHKFRLSNIGMWLAITRSALNIMECVGMELCWNQFSSWKMFVIHIPEAMASVHCSDKLLFLEWTRAKALVGQSGSHYICLSPPSPDIFWAYDICLWENLMCQLSHHRLQHWLMVPEHSIGKRFFNSTSPVWTTLVVVTKPLWHFNQWVEDRLLVFGNETLRCMQMRVYFTGQSYPYPACAM